MHHSAPARARVRLAIWIVPVGLAFAFAAMLATLGQWSVSSSVASLGGALLGNRLGAPGEVDGLASDSLPTFDEADPAVANLDPALRKALRRATRDAARDGIELHVNSGWRTPEDQEQLLRAAIAQYGSEAEAARWVGTPTTSAHVSGDAVDIGPSEATAWLSEHGAGYGLCQIYRNEPWHYELRPEATSGGCPRMYPDPTHDPRMARPTGFERADAIHIRIPSVMHAVRLGSSLVCSRTQIGMPTSRGWQIHRRRRSPPREAQAPATAAG